MQYDSNSFLFIVLCLTTNVSVNFYVPMAVTAISTMFWVVMRRSPSETSVDFRELPKWTSRKIVLLNFAVFTGSVLCVH